jgi:uncharacterized protein (DUF433 family)
MVSLPIEPELPPLRLDPYGAVRVGRSQVVLDLVVQEYLEGAEADDIARRYDTLSPADVYGAIAYYLRHRDAVDAYIGGREVESEELRRKIAAFQGPGVDRATLRARRESRQRA